EGSTLALKVPNQNKPFLLIKKIDTLIQDKVYAELGINLEVIFKELEASKEERMTYHEEKEALENKIIKEQMIKVHETYKDNSPKEKKTSNTPDHILIGKGITGNKTTIKDINEESGEVILIGDVLVCESRAIKGDRYILSFDITDYTNSITVKSFIKKDLFEERISGTVKKGC
ncbi:unnamed protein product, partial [marine sediment metagenome]